MKKAFIVFLLSFVCGMFSFAQHKDYCLEIFANVKDNVTLEAIDGGFVTLMLTDSTVVDTMTVRVSQNYRNGVSIKTPFFSYAIGGRVFPFNLP